MNMLNQQSDESLMLLLQKGSTGASEEIYKRYSQRLLALMYRMLNCNEALAQDILHDMFVQLIEKPELFDASKKFKPWIYTIAANACRKTYRGKKTENLEQLVNYSISENLADHRIDKEQRALNIEKAI